MPIQRAPGPVKEKSLSFLALYEMFDLTNTHTHTQKLAFRIIKKDCKVFQCVWASACVAT